MLACAIGSCAQASPANDLPPGLAALIEQTLPGYASPSPERQEGGHVAVGDFDANGMDDVALLLRGPDDWQIAVFRQIEPQRYLGDEIESFPGDDEAFKRRHRPDDIELEAVAPGATLAFDGTTLDDVAEEGASLVLRLPASERFALLYDWDPAGQRFGATRLHAAATSASTPAPTRCAYDPQSGRPNPLGMRALVTVAEQDGNTTFVYEQFPQNLQAAAPATLAIRRELVFHQMPIDRARALMRAEPSYYRELTGDDDPAGFAALDASLVCR